MQRSRCDVLHDLVLFVQFKKREKHQWRSVTLSKSNTPPWFFFTFFTNGIAQSVSGNLNCYNTLPLAISSSSICSPVNLRTKVE